MSSRGAAVAFTPFCSSHGVSSWAEWDSSILKVQHVFFLHCGPGESQLLHLVGSSISHGYLGLCAVLRPRHPPVGYHGVLLQDSRAARPGDF